jgi:hypothetical protein
MPKKLTKKQKNQINNRKKRIQQQLQKKRQLQQQRKKQIEKQRNIQRKKQIHRRKQQIKKRNELIKKRNAIIARNRNRYTNTKNKGNYNCRNYHQCQCNFRREEGFEEYYGNHHCNHSSGECHCGINLPPDDVCVPSRNYQFYQLPHFPNAPIYDIGNYGGGGGFGSGLGHDMRLPFISPHAGMDMFTGTLDAPMAPNPTFLSFPTF